MICMFKKKEKDFMKKKMKKNAESGYKIAYENVAVPEVHIKQSEEDAGENDNASGISYDGVAIPEIHVKKKD